MAGKRAKTAANGSGSIQEITPVHICARAGFKEVFSLIGLHWTEWNPFMRRFYFAVVFASFVPALLASSVTLTARAGDPPRLSGTGAASAPQATRIETDQKTGTVRIIIDNREVARFDAKGLHVRGDVEFSGVMIDTPYRPTTAEPKH